MREVVLHRWTTATWGIAAAAMLWAVFVIPSAQSWAGEVWMTGIALLAASTVVLCVGVGSSRMTAVPLPSRVKPSNMIGK